jgi:FKBP-type peptidyl-prolyl cis-trans isomerase
MAKAGDQLVVNYTGKLLDGTKFDSNVDTAFHHTQPFSFKLGQHQVIPGWDIGYTKISKGTKATFYIPSTLAYGEQPPPGGKIKPNDVLIFEVELVNIVQNMDPAHQFDKYFAENHINAQKTPEGLYYVITEKGTGDAPKQGQTVIANYRGKLLNGTTFDSNMDQEFKHVSPFSFALGQHMVIQGWDIGFSLLNKGSKATLYIPSNLGYGEQAQGPIPANAPLIFDVELVDIK